VILFRTCCHSSPFLFARLSHQSALGEFHPSSPLWFTFYKRSPFERAFTESFQIPSPSNFFLADNFFLMDHGTIPPFFPRTFFFFSAFLFFAFSHAQDRFAPAVPFSFPVALSPVNIWIRPPGLSLASDFSLSLFRPGPPLKLAARSRRTPPPPEKTF